MNVIKLRTIKNKDGEATGPAQAYVQTTAATDGDGSLGGVIRIAFEIEIMQGSQRTRPQGGTEYWFELDAEKAQQLSQLITLMCFPPNAN